MIRTNPLVAACGYGVSAAARGRRLVALSTGARHAHTTPLPRALCSAYLGPAALNGAAGCESPESKARKRPSLDAGAFFLPGERRACASATCGSTAGGAGSLRARRSLARSLTPASPATSCESEVLGSNPAKESRMNRKQDRARAPEESLHAAQPAPANGERLTRRIAFHSTGPHIDSPRLLSVNAGAPVEDAYALAQCLLCHLGLRFSDAVGTGEPIQGDEAYASELLIDLILSLYASTGASA